ncbi:Glycosyltransferase [Melia azedarach]|uniref:Glycosyltransferase n=1 Tax=Melia azedarach TaxID=155640 RepID=A0ACC1YUZ6_MELAZ|nr:Glycosyltransferase [Melia azedarach]
MPLSAMEYTKNSIGNFIIIFLLFAGVIYICTWSPLKSNPLLPYQKPRRFCSNSPLRTIKLPIDELELALERAAMPNKTLILAVVNSAYVQQSVKADTTMLDLFLESFWLGEETRQLLDNLLIVAVDQTAYDRCMFKRLNCYRLVTEGVDFAAEKVYMSKDFIKMMWRRTLLLLDVLKRGYSFIFTDTDVMWLRNPFVRLNKNETEDLQISVDEFNGDPRSEKNLINTGFYFIRSNNKTIELFSTWYEMKDDKNSTGKKEQDVLLDLMRDGYFQQLQLQVRFLDTKYFAGFCQDSRDIWSVTTVHSNCCRHIGAKVSDLKVVLRDWKRYKTFKSKYPGLGPNKNMTKKYRWSAHVACRNSWKTEYNSSSELD